MYFRARIAFHSGCAGNCLEEHDSLPTTAYVQQERCMRARGQGAIKARACVNHLSTWSWGKILPDCLTPNQCGSARKERYQSLPPRGLIFLMRSERSPPSQ